MSELKDGTLFECETITSWYIEDELTDEEKKFLDQMKNFKPTLEQELKL